MFSCSLTASALNHAEDVLRLHHQVVVALHLDLGSRVLAVHDHVSDAYLDVLVGARGDDLSGLVVCLGRVRQYYPRRGSLLGFDRLEQHARPQWLEPHASTSSVLSLLDAHKAKPSAAIRQIGLAQQPRG